MGRTRCFLISLLLASACFSALPAFASEQIATRAGCSVCHVGATKTLGPPFKDIAAKYRGDPKAAKTLAEHVRKGSTGVWGPIPMIPTPVERISDAELEATIQWILAM